MLSLDGGVELGVERHVQSFLNGVLLVGKDWCRSTLVHFKQAHIGTVFAPECISMGMVWATYILLMNY